MKIEKRIKELRLPFAKMAPSTGLVAVASQVGDEIRTSGHLPIQDQRLLYPGRVGKEISTENAQRSARVAAMNALAAIQTVCKDLDKIKRVLHMNAAVCSALTYHDQNRVVDSASELLVDIFGHEIGQHTRNVLGVFELPRGACIQIDLSVQI